MVSINQARETTSKVLFLALNGLFLFWYIGAKLLLLLAGP